MGTDRFSKKIVFTCRPFFLPLLSVTHVRGRSMDTVSMVKRMDTRTATAAAVRVGTRRWLHRVVNPR
eukprot:5633576-Amphidinium_carterae.1